MIGEGGKDKTGDAHGSCVVAIEDGVTSMGETVDVVRGSEGEARND